nr:hypothetical protein [Rhodococcus qingshengii]
MPSRTDDPVAFTVNCGPTEGAAFPASLVSDSASAMLGDPTNVEGVVANRIPATAATAAAVVAATFFVRVKLTVLPEIVDVKAADTQFNHPIRLRERWSGWIDRLCQSQVGSE